MNPDDWQLLQEYVQGHSDDAFARLVERYVNVVYSAALRQLRNAGMAEDVVQAVFVLFAKKAPAIGRKTVLAGWMFQTTRHIAHTALRSELRRRRRELEAGTMPSPSSDSRIWEEIAPLLDEALAHLRERERVAVLLRFFQEKSLLEVGQALGISEEAAKKRVARALERMRRFFAQRGVALSGTALAGTLLTQAVQLAPTGLAGAVAARASAGRGPAAGLVGLLVNETLRPMRWPSPQASWGLAGALAGALFVASAFLVARWQATESPDQGPPEALTASQRLSAAASPASRLESGKTIAGMLPLRIISAEDGQGLPRVPVNVVYAGRAFSSLELMTDRDGLCRIPLAGRTFGQVHASIRAAGYVPKAVRWFRHELEAGIEEYVARLDRGVLLAGQVRDGAGQPVAGATLTIGSQSTDFTRRENSAESSALTNVRGEWACDIPPQAQAFRIEVEHPDFALLRTNVSASQLTFAGPMLVLNPGVVVAGSVTTGTGEPVPEAVVTDDDRITGHDRRLSTVTDSSGQFFFPHVQPGKLRLRARSQDARDGFYDVEVSEDTDGVPILVGEPAQPHAAHLQSVGEQILRLAGRITDELTGLPIPKFEVRLGEQVVAASPPGSSYTLSDDWALLGEGRDGAFEWDCDSVPALQAFRLEIRAPGYRPKRSAPTAVGTERARFEFPLEKERTISGHLLTPTGDAAIGAIVLLSGKDLQPFIRLNAGQPLGLEIYAPSERETRTTSDSDGLFAITAGAEVDQVIVLHESGCRIAPIEAFGRGALILEPWGRIEGTLTIGGQAGGGQTAGIKRMDQSLQPAGIPLSSVNLRTDEAGRFTIPRVPAGIYRVFRVITPARPMPKRIGMSHHVQVEVRPGETSQVALGGNGRRITGRVRTVPQDAVVDWTNDLQNLARIQPAAAVSNSAGFQNAAALANATFESRECYYLAIAPDGSFEIDDVPPGNYQLSIRLTRPLEPTSFQLSPPDPEIGSLTQPVVVPDAGEDGDLTVNLGTVTVQVAPR